MCKGTGGAVAILDLRANSTDVAPVAEKVARFISSYVEVRRPDSDEIGGPAADATEVAFAELAKEGTSAVVAIFDGGAEKPSLAVFPEDRVAVINASRLKPGDGQSGTLFEERLGKEIWRGVAFVLGGYASEHPCALKAVDSLATLDNECLHMTCPPVNFKAMDFARKIGVAPYGPVPYGIAVRRGWAPPPTNDIQRAVWEDEQRRKAVRGDEAPPASPDK